MTEGPRLSQPAAKLMVSSAKASAAVDGRPLFCEWDDGNQAFKLEVIQYSLTKFPDVQLLQQAL